MQAPALAALRGEVVNDAPETRYAQAGDVHIAYQVVGEGPIDLMLLSGWGAFLDASWDEPRIAQPLRRLATISRLIRFDPRGIGCSDPVPPGDINAPDSWLDDMRTVLEAVGSERVAIFSEDAATAAAALLFTATFPDTVSALVLINGSARMLRADDYPWGLRREAIVRYLTGVVEDLRTGSWLEVSAPRFASDERFRTWWAAMRRLHMSPAAAAAVSERYLTTDVRPVLPTIHVPTLVVRRSGSRSTPIGVCRYLADNIDTATLVELPGDEHWWLAGDADGLLDVVEEFLTGAPPTLESDRVLATVLFTDIAASTQTAAAVGDRRWRSTLDEHDALVHREVDRHRGRVIKTTGDGVLATFDGPARGIACALAIRDGAIGLGIQVRAGVHTGEIDVRGDDVSGLTVVIARRVCDIAQPNTVLVSRTLVDIVAGSTLEFDDRGEHELKGVPGRWQLYAVKT